MPRTAPTPARPALAVLVLVLALAAAACGGDGKDVGAERAGQVRAAAIEAGLEPDVADVLALAARSDSATFRVVYAGTEGARTVVSQHDGDRRIDVFAGDVLVSSRVLSDGVAYRCELDEAAAATAASTPGASTTSIPCDRAAGAIDASGTFTPEALAAFTTQLGESKGTLALTIDHQQVAGVDTTCLTATPKAGTVLDGKAPGTDVLCLSADGVALLIDHAGQRQVAAEYSTTVPKGTFDV